jgi:hypothetical protein
MNLHTTLQRTQFSTKMDVLENKIEKHMDRIEHGLNTDLIEIHHVFYNEN